ncbi:hypothetical protein NMY22_g2601 [Coprinellus aureogranulatus]|nr:hypothetical protein NMY22_g2601 [Coprinellus aureogranulatus]
MSSPTHPGDIHEPIDWKTAVFQVEGKMFRVPRHAFARHSEVFEGMFLLPPKTEGVNEPITLQGYKSDDFAALLNVLYPSLENMLEGKWDLEKDQWIGVLRLATIWGMEVIRQLGIKELSKDSSTLTPLEKLTLARELKIKGWLLDGLNDLVVSGPASLKGLLEVVDTPTAYKILDIRSQTSLFQVFRPEIKQECFRMSLKDLYCPSCYQSACGEDAACRKCEKTISATDNERDLMVYGDDAILGVDFGGNVGALFSRDALQCSQCSDASLVQKVDPWSTPHHFQYRDSQDGGRHTPQSALRMRASSLVFPLGVGSCPHLLRSALVKQGVEYVQYQKPPYEQASIFKTILNTGGRNEPTRRYRAYDDPKILRDAQAVSVFNFPLRLTQEDEERDGYGPHLVIAKEIGASQFYSGSF